MEPWVSCNPGTDTPSLDHFTPYLQCSTRNETNQNSSLGIVELVCTKLEAILDLSSGRSSDLKLAFQ
nr:hypothetical protein Iba_chr04cCG3450 [Ipomoea batatas]